MNRFIILWAVCLLIYSCKTPYYHLYNTNFEHLVIDTSSIIDTHFNNEIAVYKQKIDAEMSQVIGTCAKVLSKGQPESLMGNFITDVIHAQAEQYIGQASDLTVLNYGGLRVDYMPAGQWTVGNIFELMPFDNTLVMIEVKGSILKQFLNLIASKDGWPTSKHLKMVIKDKQLLSATINNQPIEDNKNYKLITNDYLVAGGDNCTFFVGIPNYSTGKFIREVIIEHIRTLTAKNIILDAELDHRIQIID